MRGVSRMDSLAILLEAATRSYNDDEMQRLADRKNARFCEAITTLTANDVVGGVQPMLDALGERDIRIAAASSSRNARRILAQLRLSARLDAIVDGNDVSRSKPDPDVFLKAATLIGVDPASCVVVEDASAGIEAARRAGMRVIGIGSSSALKGADEVVDSFNDLTLETLLDPGRR